MVFGLDERRKTKKKNLKKKNKEFSDKMLNKNVSYLVCPILWR